jgi:hypothetical protein
MMMSKKSKLLLLLFFIVVSGTADVHAQKVYVTRTGEKYHRSSCHYLKYSSVEIELRDAKKKGYTRCSVCKPVVVAKDSTVSSQQLKPVAPVIKEGDTGTTATQCSATTKAGTRCKRTTTNSNGRCWQHQ